MADQKIPAASVEAVPAETGEVTRAPAPAKRAKGKTAKKPERRDDFCVYLGPTIIGVIQRGTVFTDSKQEVIASLSSAIERYPLIATLIVGSSTLPEDHIKVKKPGNLLYVNYHALAKGIK